MEPTHKLCCNQANRIFGLIKITCKGLNDPATLRTLYCSLGVAHFEGASPQIAYKKFIRPLTSNFTSTLTGFDLLLKQYGGLKSGAEARGLLSG